MTIDMKIAIMTQPLGHNYGGMMQAWALQKLLIGLGHDVITINRRSDAPGLFFKYTRVFYRLLKSLVNKKYSLKKSNDKPLFLFAKKNISFIKNNIFMSNLIDNEKKLRKYFDRNKFDAVIVGSDQTWRPSYSPKIDNYFLDFLTDKDICRIAYASSFGVDYWEFDEIQTAYYSKLIKLFNAVGVREDSGVQLCKKHLNIDAIHVLDPTLLIDKSAYLSLIGGNRLNAECSDIYTYILDKSANKTSLITRICKFMNEKAFSCQSKEQYNPMIKQNVSDIVMPDIRDWLAGFANSKYVITDSFHGMVFSIIFMKPFIAIVNKERGASRFYALAKMLNLSERLIEESSIEAINNFDVLKCSIKTDALDSARKYSYNFLTSSLNRLPRESLQNPVL